MSDIVLVTMPWDVLESPSLALGTLQSILRNEGFEVETKSLKLRWMDYLLQHQRLRRNPISLVDYEKIACQGSGVGDWVFAERPMASSRGIVRYGALLRGKCDRTFRSHLREMRRLAPTFLEECTAEVLACRPRVVGFTTTFCQNMASLALARRLKRDDPSLRIVFGGGNCEGPMGAALQRCFPWIDAVVRGEGETIVPDLFRSLLDRTTPRPAPGLCYFVDGRQVVVPNLRSSAVAMDAVPMPDYDDYFADLSRCSFGDTVLAAAFLSFESARGCWWGEVAHCTFCGLNGENMAFRSKSPKRVVDDILQLARRYRVLDLHAVDNILDHSYLRDVLPEVARSGVDLRLFYEVKSNLRKAQLQILHRAGVRRIQPGIESLSTPILKLMKKGVTAWQNLRLLKWCAELGIEPEWNLLYGFPGEPEEEYRALTELLPSLSHLRPPETSAVAVHRFSPYHQRPDEHNIVITGPAWHYPFLYDVDQSSLAEIAYEFEFEPRGGPRPLTYATECVAAVHRWRELHNDGASLVYRRGPGFILIRDGRNGSSAQHVVDFVLEGPEGDVYLACDDGARFRAICERTDLEPALVQRVLDELLAERLIYREDDHYLGLALPTRPLLVEATIAIDQREPERVDRLVGLVSADRLSVRPREAAAR